MNLHGIHLHSFALPPPPVRRKPALCCWPSTAALRAGLASIYCGHVFANAETGNMISLFSELHAGQWLGVLVPAGRSGAVHSGHRADG